VNDSGSRVVFLFRNPTTQRLVNARHRAARLDALRRGVAEIVDPQTAPPDELAARRAKIAPTQPT
jgi:hypothetical protein